MDTSNTMLKMLDTKLCQTLFCVTLHTNLCRVTHMISHLTLTRHKLVSFVSYYRNDYTILEIIARLVGPPYISTASIDNKLSGISFALINGAR